MSPYHIVENHMHLLTLHSHGRNFITSPKYVTHLLLSILIYDLKGPQDATSYDKNIKHVISATKNRTVLLGANM